MSFVPQEQNTFEEISNSSSFSIEDKISLSIKATNKLFDMHLGDIFHSEICSQIFIYDNIQDDVILTNSENCYSSKPDDITYNKLQYLSPEQTGRVNQITDYRSDLYSFGIVMFKLFTHKYPFDYNDPIKLVHSHIAQKPPYAEHFNKNIPTSLSLVIDKLLNKDPDERYQSASGLRFDLEQILIQLKTAQKTQITLATRDFSHKPIIPQKVYGRVDELKVINELYNNVLNTNQKELLNISGYSGIGKTTLIQQISKSIREDNGYLLKGKFEQYKSDKPYYGLNEALGEFINYILLEDENIINDFKENVKNTLGENAKIIAEMIPELNYILETNDPIPPLNPQENQNRFNLTFLSFIKLICDFKGSVILCLDDMQWADLATIKMIDNIMNDVNINNILIILSYRSNEVKNTHPLFLMLDDLNSKKIRNTAIKLKPLLKVDINTMLSDTLGITSERVKELAKLVKEKTNGNPFFSKEFIYNLYDNDMLYFDTDDHAWSWDISKIEERSITENVVDLILKKISYLSEETIEILKFSSCLETIRVENTANILEVNETQVKKAFQEAIELGILLPILRKSDIRREYKFSHDKVTEAMNYLMSDYEKEITHLKIGYYIIEHFDDDKKENKIFNITDHLNKGQNQIMNEEQVNELAQFNYQAAYKAKESNAYANAIKYLNNILSLLSDKEDIWKNQYEFLLKVYTLLSEVYYLNLDFKNAKDCYDLVIDNIKKNNDKIEISQIQIYSLIAQNKMLEALNLGLDIVAQSGVELPEEDDLFTYYPRLFTLYEREEIHDFIKLPQITDVNTIHIIDILNAIMSPAYLASPVTYPKICYVAIKLCLENGICAASANVFSVHALLLCGFFDKFEEGYEFSKLSQNIVEKFETKEYSCKVEMISNACVVHWNKPLRETLEPMKKSILIGIDNGDIEYACYSAMYYCLYSLLSGKNIDELLNEYRVYLNLMKELKQEYQTHYVSVWRQFLLNLKEYKKDPTLLEGEAFSESESLQTLEDSNNISTLYCLYLSKAILGLMYGDIKKAYKFINKAKLYLLGVASLYHYNEFRFYESLIVFSYYKEKDKISKEEVLETLEKNYLYYESVVQSSVDNNKYKLLMINGLIQSLNEQNDAWKYFDMATKESEKQELPYVNALCNMFSADYWAEENMDDFTNLYVQKAYDSYESWNATQLTKELEKNYPIVFSKKNQEEKFNLTNFDFESVMKATHAISEEISLEELLNKIMKIIVENSGSQLGFLLLQNEKKLRVEAAYDFISKSGTKDIKTVISMPDTIINFVKRSESNVIYSASSSDKLFKKDPYIKAINPKSIFCLPIIYKQEFLGILYLENRDIYNLYTEDKIQFVKLLSHQAAISIEHAKLFKQTIEHSHTLEETVSEKTKALQLVVEELRVHATIDSMTGLNNRRYFFELSTNMFYEAQKNDDSLHAFVLDIDEFKVINDTYGHSVGDQAIKLFAKSLEVFNSNNCILGRLGGDEFVILARGKEESVIEYFVDNIKRNISDISLQYGNTKIGVSASIGVASCSPRIHSLDELILEADADMYKDKSKNKSKTIRTRV